MARKKIIVGKKEISEDCQPFFIAEIGINHNGDIGICKRLIDASFACGWESVKFQKRVPELCVPEQQKSRPKETPWGKMTYLEYKHRIEFGKEDYDYIDRYCREKPVSWSASVWDIPSLEFILKYNPDYLKVPSAKLTESELLIRAASSGRPVVVSTGMSTMAEIDAAVESLEKYSDGNYILMHTNSAYPAPLDELNLKMIKTLKGRYGCLVGYSGHEYNLEPTVIAAAMGACVIERHITLDHNMWGSDQAASLEIHAMHLLRQRVLGLGGIVGDGVKRITDNEMASRKKLGGHLVAEEGLAKKVIKSTETIKKVIESEYDSENIFANIGL